MKKLVEVFEPEGGVFGPVFTTYRGDLANPGGYGAVFWKVYLEKVQANTDLIDDKVDTGIHLFLLIVCFVNHLHLD